MGNRKTGNGARLWFRERTFEEIQTNPSGVKWLEYTLSDLEKMEASGLPIRAKLYYWDQKRVKILDVERIDFDLWEIVVKQGKEFQYIAIHLCELSTVEPKANEDLREIPGPNSK